MLEADTVEQRRNAVPLEIPLEFGVGIHLFGG